MYYVAPRTTAGGASEHRTLEAEAVPAARRAPTFAVEGPIPPVVSRRVPMCATHPESPAPGLPRELPLVGRSNELDRLYRLFGDDEVEPIVFVSGEAGVGKTRLAATLMDEARRRGWAVAEGRAYPVETGMPFSLLSDAFLPLLREVDEATLTVLTRGTSGDLRQLFPALGGGVMPPREWDPGEFRTRLFWSFTEFLKRFAERGPLLIVAEDLHWADDSSLSLLHFIARQVEGAPIRVVATYSRDYGGDLGAIARIEQSLRALARLRSLPLAPFDRAATRELVSRVFQVGGAPLDAFSGHLFDWTHGNVYFIGEILESLVETGRLYLRDGTWLGWEVRDIDPPRSVRDAVLARVGGLSESARALADLAAVGGGRTAVRLLGWCGELDDDGLAAAVGDLSRSGMATEREEDSEVVLELRHPMLRETLYRELGPTRRRLLHRRLAEGLETLHADGAAPVDQLAYHFTRGGPPGPDPRAARYLAEAGRAALVRHADREAVAYLEAALARSPDDSDAQVRAALQADLARGQARLGQYTEARQIWASLRRRAVTSNDAEARADADRHLGLNAFWDGRPREALEHFDSALEGVPSDRATALEARIQLAAGVALQEMGRPESAGRRIQRALTLARALGDPTLLCRTHRALALLSTWVGEADAARSHGWQAVELADRAGDDYVRFWGRWAVASLEGLVGNTDEMRRLMRQAGQVADELRSPVLRLWTAELEVEYAYAMGDWDGALAQGERAIQLATSLGQTTLLPRLLVWTATVYLGRGDLDRGRELADRAWALAGLREGEARVGDVHIVVPAHLGAAACLLAEERHAEAIAVGEAGAELADRAGYLFWSLHLLLPIVSEAYLRIRDLPAATAIGRRLRGEGSVRGHRLAVAWADAIDAIVAWLSGDLERGIDLLRSAADALDAIPVRWEAARVRRQLAGRLIEVGRGEEALVELRRVHEIFGDLGARPELEKCRAMFRELGARPPSRIEAEGTSDLTPREVEVAELVSRRLSNKAVARHLGIAPRTVTTHLSNIYRKLGISSRGALVDLVREGRLSR